MNVLSMNEAGYRFRYNLSFPLWVVVCGCTGVTLCGFVLVPSDIGSNILIFLAGNFVGFTLGYGSFSLRCVGVCVAFS